MNDESKTTLDCTDIKAMLSPLIDGELADADRHRAERHLAGCAACRDLVSETERTEAIVAAAVELDTELPEGFEEAVLLRTVVAHRSRARRFRATLGWLAVAAAVMLVLTLWVIVRGGWTTERPGSILASDPPQAMFASRIIPNEVPVYPLENAMMPAVDPVAGPTLTPAAETAAPAPVAPRAIPRDSA
jgi:anti-sigma factor RsiW